MNSSIIHNLFVSLRITLYIFIRLIVKAGLLRKQSSTEPRNIRRKGFRVENFTKSLSKCRAFKRFIVSGASFLLCTNSFRIQTLSHNIYIYKYVCIHIENMIIGMMMMVDDGFISSYFACRSCWTRRNAPRGLWFVIALCPKNFPFALK